MALPHQKQLKLIIRTSDPRLREKLRHAARFFEAKLFQPKLACSLTVTIWPKLVSSTLDGYTTNTSVGAGRPKRFSIGIAERLPLEGKIRTLAHEFEHVRQFATGELRELRSTTHYKGWIYPVAIGDVDAFISVPWELDALKREYYLMSLYVYRHADILFGTCNPSD